MDAPHRDPREKQDDRGSNRDHGNRRRVQLGVHRHGPDGGGRGGGCGLRSVGDRGGRTRRVVVMMMVVVMGIMGMVNVRGYICSRDRRS